MATSKLIASYTDPVFDDIKQSFQQRSDDFPVALLPVRLETRFMNETRYVSVKAPGQSKINVSVLRIYRLNYDVEILLANQDKYSQNTILNKLVKNVKSISSVKNKVNGIPNISADDRRILNDATKDLNTTVGRLDFSNAQLSNHAEQLKDGVQVLQQAIRDLKPPADSIYKKGYAYLDALKSIEKSVEDIYVKRSATPFTIDLKLDNIENQITHVNEMIQESDFRATSGTISKIKSKISYIKRQQKNSSIKLFDYKNGYTGGRDLRATEYTLRGAINSLKTRIDEEHAPFMNLLEQLKRYPTRRLTYRVIKTYFGLKADNQSGFSNLNQLMETKEWLYDQLHAIRERAHRPLDGDYYDIVDLKTRYEKLDAEIKRFIKKSKKFKPQDRYKKAALTRLDTHLTDEYLDDLQDLRPGVKEIEQQVFSDAKVRTTSTSATKTKKQLEHLRDFVKNANGSQDNVLHQIKDEIKEAKAQIAVSSSNTILVPKTLHEEIKRTLDSLKGHMYNMQVRNNVIANHPILTQDKELIADIETFVEDQHTDVFDARDRFYDDYKKRITFILKTETVKELWVRIYPDDIAIDNHDERITDQEEKIAQDYYYEVYSKDEEVREEFKLGAWRAAAASMGVRRAAYVVKEMLPSEVRLDIVRERVNGMRSLVKAFKKFTPLSTKIFKKGKRNQPLFKNGKLERLINSLAGDLQNALAETAFDKCLENKNSLDNFLTILTRIDKELAKESKKGADISDITDLRQKIANGAQIVIEFYKANLEDLNNPYRPTLSFPELEKKSKSWDRAGITEVMPDRFVVVTKRGGNYEHIVVGEPIVKPLQVSIDPSEDANQAERFKHLPNGELEVPEEIKWLFDFDAAVDAGMAVRIPLHESDFSLGFDLVMAFGIQNGDEQVGQATLDKLFKNHLYSTGGVEYLPVGTATNNTEDVKTPYKAIDNDYDEAFELFFNQTPTYYFNNLDNELNITDGQFFKDALGLDEEVANYIRNHDKKDIAEGRAMNRALYNATLKYYFHVMIDNLVNSNDIGQTLPFLMQNVSAVGNLPAFRVDAQPYGVLPITPYRDFKVSGSTNKGTEGSYLKQLTIFLNATRNAFESFSNAPQTVNSDSYETDPQKEFIKILGLEPYSKEFFYRFGTNLAGRWNEDPGEDVVFPVNWENMSGEFTPDKIAAHYSYLLKGLGHDTPGNRMRAIRKTKAYINRYLDANYVGGNLVQDYDLGLEKLAQLEGGEDEGDNYIDWLVNNFSDSERKLKLRTLAFTEFPRVNVEGESVEQNSLLFLMLRGALIYDDGFYAKRAMDNIKNLDVKKLERLIANHLDLCSYRLDAWLGGLSNYRLNEMRQSNSTGTYVGAYGFVEGLKGVDNNQETRVEHLPNGLTPVNGADVYRKNSNQGFIHGPTMNHAVTAAVLRAGYNSLKSRDDNNNALAINLSSSRVRKALHLLEGVSGGQEAGALLGYMLERALHDKYTDGASNPLEMDVHIYRLRRKFPTFGDMPKDADIDLSQNESIKAANVLDGIAMIDHFESELENSGDLDGNKTFVEMIIDDSSSTPVFNGFPWGLADELPDPSDPGPNSTATLERLKLRAIIHELDNMADAFDALGDLMTSEGVYQLVRGNHVRASAVLNALADGKVPLDPEIINSMRQGVMVTHRSILNIPVAGSQTSPWPGIAMSPKAKVEPAVNSWLASQIGAPDQVDWSAKFGNTESYITLEDLGMQPIDLVLLITSGGEEALAEIEMRCVNYLLANGALPEDDIELNFNFHSPAATLSLGEIISLLHNLGKVVLASRQADARDFRVAEAEENFGLTAAGIDTAALRNRITDALADYETLLNSLSVFTPEKTSYSAGDTDLAFDKLIELGQWGFSGFYPARDAKDDVLAMASKIISAKSKMEENVTFVNEKLAVLDLELDHVKWLSATTEIANRLFGSGFKVLPTYSISNTTELRDQLDLNHSVGILRNHPSDYMDEWLSSIALVRKRMSAIESARLLSGVLFDRSESINVAQLPPTSQEAAERDYWIGAEYPDSFVPDGDRLSLICLGQENIASNGCALVLDEWMEIIPDEKETTGIALHYNQPDARPPQTILLAVPPEKTGKWEIEDLALSVEEALNMAKLRAVEPEHVDFSMFSQLLPATATLAFGHDELARRENPSYSGDDPDADLGTYIDYTLVNRGVESVNTDN